MVALVDLWLPIVMAAVLVFVASSVLHMVLPLHRSDYGKLPGEDAVREALRAQGVPPGQYMFPSAKSMKDMASPEMQEKFTRGPVGHMVVLPSGPPAIGKNLAQWFVFTLVVGLFVAYAASIALPAGAECMRVFRLTSTVAILGYGVSSAVDSIWKGVSWGTTAKYLFDGIVYGLVTAGSFAWLWPEGMA